MSKNNITRKIARVEACKFSHKDVQRLNNRPDMDCCESSNWLFDFGNWIETAYGGKLASYEEMAEEFNANRKRKFIDRDGKAVSYCRVVSNYLRFMCLAENHGKCYTISRFKAYMTEHYKEVYA